MEVFDRRRVKLAEILNKTTAADLARKSGVAASYISRCMKNPSDDGYKSIGEVTARKLEKGASKPEGWLDGSPTLSGTELTSHVNPPLHQASSGALAPATLQNALEFLAGYLSALDAGDRARAVRDIADLADEPQAVAKITARIEAMASPAFTDKKRSNG